MKEIFLLYHDRLHDKDRCNVFSEKAYKLGVFKSKKEAKKKIGYYQGKPGFSDYPNDFYILKLKVNKIYFKEGF